MEDKKPNNPRMQEFDGMYANDAYGSTKDYYSLRDEFAGKAMQSLIVKMDDKFVRDPNYFEFFSIGELSYNIADLMLKQRELPTETK